LITLVLPAPPSTNNLFINVKRGRVKSQRYRDWLDKCGVYLMQQSFEKGTIIGAYVMDIKVYAKTRADITNLFKAVEDVLVSTGVLPDDKHCFRATIERSYDVPEEDCYVTVRGIKMARAA
jgi:Holliday junction resolvase RusA-like endonuclease